MKRRHSRLLHNLEHFISTEKLQKHANLLEEKASLEEGLISRLGEKEKSPHVHSGSCNNGHAHSSKELRPKRKDSGLPEKTEKSKIIFLFF